MKKKIRRHSHKILSAVGMAAGLALNNITALQGALPNGWYIGLFAVIFIIDLVANHGDE
jgi:hypothetical protein